MTLDYSPWLEREIWPFLKVAISPKLKKLSSPKLVFLHLTSIATCMNFFLSDSNRLIFLMTMDYSPWSEREIWPFLKVAISLKLKKAILRKIGVHSFDINPYLHEFFEPIPIN